MNRETLATAPTQRDQGVIISDKGLPGNQCALVPKKAIQVLGQINRSFTRRTKDIMLPIFKVFVRPHLEYGVAAWSLWQKKEAGLL